MLDFPKPLRRVAWDLAHMPDAWPCDDVVSCVQYVYGAITGTVVPADQIPLGPVARSDVHRSEEEVEAALARLEVAASWPGLAPAKRRQFFEWAVVVAGTPDQFLEWIVELEKMDGEGRA
ncbi:hypothetical protein AMAG_17509 [Allomyces macrogynus ATCC 38327]|uniref:Uncharacterized protein n=1 Tax=Allomyces macrogynus (strain ATCC 38327) TaxID=578462 RepID=A0A0L0TES9_ALLM3|nr:hypothetical protein AMAG_17509 [Allomyces macrogynus ATCC 38327]|eukprot:KNE73358.1 hypothetical protein AMAG_17509 [Allomyces macrogynus ATCC 38327]